MSELSEPISNSKIIMIAEPMSESLELTDEQWLGELQILIESQLKPDVEKIDGEGFYPRQFMHNYGALGG